MVAISKLTVSVSKGKTSESSTAHNNRKTRLKNASEDKIKKFYEQTGHTHIHQEYTKLNEDYIKDPRKLYDALFEDAVKQYNSKQKRKDRMIGKGLALTVKEKQGKIALLKMVCDYKGIKSNKKRAKFLTDLTKKQPKMAKFLKDSLPSFKKMTLRDTSKMLTQAKHAQTLGEALYDKQKHGKQTNTRVEFIFQVGSAEDFNELDKNGRIKKSYDRLDPSGIWQKSKKVLKDYEKTFEKENPNLIVANASLHMDEATPHMHVEVIPVAETAKTLARGKKHKGLSVKPAFDGALECEGFKRDPHDSRKAFKQWQNREADTLAKIMQNEMDAIRKTGITNRLKDVHEYKKAKEAISKQLENANNYKKIANKNYEIYQTNAKAVKTVQSSLDNLTNKVSKAQKKLSDVSKERQRQLTALTQEMAQKRSERLRELSNEMAENRKKEEKKLKVRENSLSERENSLNKRENRLNAHENSLSERENSLNKRENRLNAHEIDVNAAQYGGIDSKGIKHKSIEQRVKEGITHGIKKVQKALLHPLDAFIYAYRKSMVEQSHPTYTSDQVKNVATRQETYLAQHGESRSRILKELASDKFEKKSVKAIGAGTKALAKSLPSYDAIGNSIHYAVLLDKLEHEEQRHAEQQHKQAQQKQTLTVSKTKEDSPDITDSF